MNFIQKSKYYKYPERSCDKCANQAFCLVMRVSDDFPRLMLAKVGCSKYREKEKQKKRSKNLHN